jgi:ER-bound oxygenase mpaB/B'/Rubber oxygenase, catalytic domain
MNSTQQQANIPQRHGMDPIEAKRIAASTLWFIKDKAGAQPTAEQWQRLGLALNEGDEPADTLVSWMHEHGLKESRALFERVLSNGLGAVPDTPEALRSFFEHVETPPNWLDKERVENGVAASYVSGLTGFRVLRDAGLMAGYQAGAINKTLVITGTLEKGAARRIAETTKWRMDCSAAQGLNRFNEGFKNTIRVRVIHAMVRRHVSNHPQWDADMWGLPINQVDMQATYLGFSTVFLLGQRVMGTYLTKQEAEDVMHLWRYIGWLMGVKEEWLCDSEQAGRIALYQNLLSQAPADESSVQLGRALMDEPLARQYPRWRWLTGQWNKAVHLSMCRLFVGKKGMKSLGLPTWIWPWYPVMFAPFNLAWCIIHRVLPGGRQRLIEQGRRAQWAQVDIMFGQDKPQILNPTHST